MVCFVCARCFIDRIMHAVCRAESNEKQHFRIINEWSSNPSMDDRESGAKMAEHDSPDPRNNWP